MKHTLEELLELLTHHDTVVARLTGLGETELCSAKELYDILDRQIPTKPVLEPFHDIMRQQTCYHVKCSMCGTKLGTVESIDGNWYKEWLKDHEWFKHCIECGQTIDWSKDE